jgi:cytochrome P450
VIQHEKEHAKYRKLVSNAYSMTSLKDFEPYVGEIVDQFVEVCGGSLSQRSQ